MKMSKESQLARKPGEVTTLDRAGPFDLTAMQMMADKIPQLQEFMNKNLKQGKDADWEYTDVVWKRTLRAGEDRKAMMLDPGVGKIMNFMQMRPRHRIVEKEIDTRTNNLRYVVAVEIVPYVPIMYHNPITNGMEPYFPVVAEGVGSATTREKRYRVSFEYFKERDLKAQGWTEEEFQKFTADNTADFVKGEAPTRLFYLPTAESLGADNTLLKMASKRAEMDAVFQLPGVAGRYSQEIDLKEDRGEEKPTTPPTSPPVAQHPVSTLPSTPPTEEVKPAENPNLRSVNLGDPVEKIIAEIQMVNKGLSRAQILQKIGEEKAKTAGLLTDEAVIHLVASTLLGAKAAELLIDEAAAYIVKDSLIPSTGFKSASELPKVPDSFRPSEEAGYAIDFIVENFSQQLETVRALVYREMVEAEPHLSDVEAVKVVREGFEKRSKSPVEASTVEDIEKALDAAKLDSMRLNISNDGEKIQPKKFLDDWEKFNFALRPLGFEWIRDGSNGRWEQKV